MQESFKDCKIHKCILKCTVKDTCPIFRLPSKMFQTGHCNQQNVPNETMKHFNITTICYEIYLNVPEFFRNAIY